MDFPVLASRSFLQRMSEMAYSWQEHETIHQPELLYPHHPMHRDVKLFVAAEGLYHLQNHTVCSSGSHVYLCGSPGPSRARLTRAALPTPTHLLWSDCETHLGPVQVFLSSLVSSFTKPKGRCPVLIWSYFLTEPSLLGDISFLKDYSSSMCWDG